MIITQKIICKVSKCKCKFFKNLGYTLNNNEIELTVQELKKLYPKYNKEKIQCKCDNCGKIFNVFVYAIDFDRILCSKCKAEDSNLKRYGYKCSFQSPEVRETYKKNNLKKYGVEYPQKLQVTKDKAKQTIKAKYGEQYESTSQVPEIKDKQEQTCLQRYGYKIASQSAEIQAKMKQTCLKRYGYENASYAPEIKQKIKNIYNNKTEEEKQQIRQKAKDTYNNKTEEEKQQIRQKAKRTIKARYGEQYESTSQVPAVRKKITQTLYKNGTTISSKKQRYLHALFGGILNYPLSTISLDIAFPNDNIALEYDGKGHNLSVKLGSITDKQFQQKEIRREKFIFSQNFKLIRFISNNDRLPNDTVLINIFNMTYKYLLYTSYKWINVNFNSKQILCSEGIFSFTKLNI